MTPEYLETILKQNEPKDIVRVISVESEPALNKGENFMSIITRYKVKVLLLSGENVTKSMIVKSFPNEKEHCEFLKEFCFFKNEIHAYSRVLCQMKQLMEEFQDKRETMWSEMIYYRPYNLLILEDLKELSYKPMKRRDNLDYNHSVYVIKSLARFHAMSAVLLKRNTVRSEEFEPYTFAKRKVVKLFFWCCLTVLEKAIRDYWGQQWIHFAELVKNVAEQTYDKLQELIKIDNSRFNIINHGDGWTNNLMFKHIEATNFPCGIKFVDYQITHYNSFAWDLTYFFYTSILPDVRRANYSEFLMIYHKELYQNLQYFNYPETEIPRLNHIYNEMDRIKFYGFLLLTTIYPWTSAETDNPYDVEMALTNEECPERGVNIDIFTCPKYRSLVEKDLIQFIRQGVI